MSDELVPAPVPDGPPAVAPPDAPAVAPPDAPAVAPADAPAPPPPLSPTAGVIPDPKQAEVPGIVPDPAPGTHRDDLPAKEVSANAHGEAHAPVVGYVDHQIRSTEGHPINVHTPGLTLAPKPDVAD